MSSSYIGAEPLDTYSSLAVQHFTTSATTSYSLSQSVTSENDIRLTINSVVQQPGSSYAYTCSGTTLTLSSATASSDTMHCVFIGKSIGTTNPPDGSVGASQLTTNAVSNSAMADDAVGIAELSATGTPSSTTFLAGNNTWSAPAGGADTSLSNLSATGQDKVCTAWVNFNGTGTIAIRDSFNVSSITDTNVGSYGVNFASNMSNINYAVAVGEGQSANFHNSAYLQSIAVGSFNITLTAKGSSTTEDSPFVNAIIMGGL